MKILILNGGPQKQGATAKISEIIAKQLSGTHITKQICLGDKRINYCLGCKACYNKGICCQDDDVDAIVQAIYNSDTVITVVPSYWAEIPGQMKVFIDRCTPYSNTNPNRIKTPHKTIGYTIALRTGLNPAECEGIIKSIDHFYGHMEIIDKESTYLCGINDMHDIEEQANSIISICGDWFGKE